MKDFLLIKLIGSYCAPARHLVGGQLLSLLHAACIRWMRFALRTAPDFAMSFDSWKAFAGNSVVSVTYRFMDGKNDVNELVLDALPLKHSYSAANLSSCST